MRSPAVAAMLLLGGAAVGGGIAVLLLPAGTPVPPSPAPPPSAVPAPEVGPAGGASVAPDHPPPPAAGPVAPAPGPDPLSDLGVRPEEWTFLRGALQKERDRREGARMDPALGGLEAMRRVKEEGVDPFAILESYESVRARVRVTGTTRAIEAPPDGSPVNLAALAGDAAIVEFGPGTFTLDRRSEEFLRVREGARSLEIRGAGMDRTFLTGSVSDFLMVLDEAAFENLVVRDLTLEGGDRGAMLLDVRGRLSAALENVRVRGWMSAGHSAAIGVSGSAIFGARGCEFVEGEGLFVLSIRGLSLAVFEKCLFAGGTEAAVGPGGADPGSAVRFLDCTFENCPAASRRMERTKGKPAFPVAVRGGTVALGPPDLGDEERRFLWGAPYLASWKDVTFGPGVPPCTVGDLLSVLDRVSVSSPEAVYGVRNLGAFPGGPVRFGIRVIDRSNAALSWRVVGPDGSDLEKAPRNPGGGWNPPRAAAMEGIGLAAAIRLAEIPLSSDAAEAALSSIGSGEGEILGVYIRPRTMGYPDWLAEAATGKILRGGPARR